MSWDPNPSIFSFRAFWRPSTTVMAHCGVEGDGRGSQPIDGLRRAWPEWPLPTAYHHHHICASSYLCRTARKRSSARGAVAAFSGQCISAIITVVALSKRCQQSIAQFCPHARRPRAAAGTIEKPWGKILLVRFTIVPAVWNHAEDH